MTLLGWVDLGPGQVLAGLPPHQVADGGLQDASEAVVVVDEVVASVEVAVGLEDHGIATGGAEDA
jgi:hypothetical protein